MTEAWPPNCLHYVSVVLLLYATWCALVTRALPLLSPLSLPVLARTETRRRIRYDTRSARAGLEIRLTVNLSRLPLLFSPLIKREVHVCACVNSMGQRRTNGRKKERSVEFDRDVAHGEAKLCKTLSSRPSSTFAHFSHRRSPSPLPGLLSTRFTT